MNKIEAFIREINNRADSMYGGYTATPILKDNIVMRVEVQQRYGGYRVSKMVSLTDIKQVKMGELELAQLVMRELNEELLKKRDDDQKKRYSSP